MGGVLVLITGTGRSGTSTMAGSLHHLGLSVPGPYLSANASNPKGFYESRWSVHFHNRIFQAAGTHLFDSRPGAFDRVQEAITPRDREELEEFIAQHAATAEQVVVKDPRTVWTQQLWREAASAVGLDIRYISMLRHPAEVVGSRSTYYSKTDAGSGERQHYEALNVTRWINNALVNERGTRGVSRAFVRYDDLLTDWRPVAVRLRDELGLQFDTDLDPAVPHAVDDFIDSDLRRHSTTWDDLEVPTHLATLAEGIWETLGPLGAAPQCADPASSAAMDVWSKQFDRVRADADAIIHDGLDAVPASAPAPAQRAPGLEGMPVGDVGGKDLLRIIGRRARAKLSRRPR